MSKSLRTVPLTALVLTLSAVCGLVQGGVTNSIKNAQQASLVRRESGNRVSIGSFALGIAYDGPISGTQRNDERRDEATGK